MHSRSISWRSSPVVVIVLVALSLEAVDRSNRPCSTWGAAMWLNKARTCCYTVMVAPAPSPHCGRFWSFIRIYQLAHTHSLIFPLSLIVIWAHAILSLLLDLPFLQGSRSWHRAISLLPAFQFSRKQGCNRDKPIFHNWARLSYFGHWNCNRTKPLFWYRLPVSYDKYKICVTVTTSVIS